jgi:hypothetical protein
MEIPCRPWKSHGFRSAALGFGYSVLRRPGGSPALARISRKDGIGYVFAVFRRPCTSNPGARVESHSTLREIRERRHRIDDYARPALPLPVKLVNAVAGPFARRLFPLGEAGLLAAAGARAGLTDFGDGGFRQPLRVLLAALEGEAKLTPLGRFLTRQLLLQLLVTRLRARDLLVRHPEIENQGIEAPIVIMGLPRTGTTHLHNLVAQDPDLHSLTYWESLEPIPAAADRPAPGAADPRIARCAQGLRLLHYLMPLFPLMHEMTPEARHEEIQLLAVEFSTMLFEASYQIPSYRDWYKASDQTAAYATLKRMLQILQWRRGGGGRWVLKTPQHLEQIGPLLATFPDAKLVQTHRDPVRVTASFCTMGAYGLRMNAGGIDAAAVGRYWADRIEDMLRASIDDRPRIPEEQIFDMRFHEFMADDLPMVERIYDFAGQPMSDRARRAMQAQLAANPRGKHGSVDYRLEDFGIDPGELRLRLAFYQQRFDIPDD